MSVSPPQLLLTDSSKYYEDTGFTNPIDFETAVSQTFKYAKENPSVLGDTPNYGEEKKTLELFYGAMDQLHNEI